MELPPLQSNDLVGSYDIVSGEKFGQPEPEERLRGNTVRFTPTTVVVYDKEKNETYAANYHLDPGQAPCRIIMKSTQPNSGDTVQGLIEKEGDIIRLIYALPGGEAPIAFRTRELQLMFVMTKTSQ